jgi:hypothetical protein
MYKPETIASYAHDTAEEAKLTTLHSTTAADATLTIDDTEQQLTPACVLLSSSCTSASELCMVDCIRRLSSMSLDKMWQMNWQPYRM